MQTTTADSSEVIPFPAAPVAELSREPGYAKVRFNALKHGVLSQFTVLAHEDGNEFCDLLDALVAEHQPAGATETLRVFARDPKAVRR